MRTNNRKQEDSPWIASLMASTRHCLNRTALASPWPTCKEICNCLPHWEVARRGERLSTWIKRRELKKKKKQPRFVFQSKKPSTAQCQFKGRKKSLTGGWVNTRTSVFKKRRKANHFPFTECQRMTWGSPRLNSTNHPRSARSEFNPFWHLGSTI